MDTKNEALGDNQGHNQSLAAVGKTDSSLAIEHINHSYNIIRGGRRIASYLTQAKAIQFAVQYV